jgi:hypothetical protein
LLGEFLWRQARLDFCAAYSRTLTPLSQEAKIQARSKEEVENMEKGQYFLKSAARSSEATVQK